MLILALLKPQLRKLRNYQSKIGIYSAIFPFSRLSDEEQQALIAEAAIKIINSSSRDRYFTDKRSIR